MKRKFLHSMILALSFNATSLAQAAPLASPPPENCRRQTMLVTEEDTGNVLFSRDQDKLVYPASLTKMMTLYVTFDALKKGTLKLKDKLPVSERAASQVSTNLQLKAGDALTVEQAILALVTQSANDAAVALAEGISGTEVGFVSLMNDKAQVLGMTRTNFTNAHGLPDRDQVTTAHDMVLLTKAHIRDFPQYRHYFETETFAFHGRVYRNHNRLLRTVPEVDFGKTGYISASGFNLAVSAVRGDERLYAVVFGEPTAAVRNQKMTKLLNRGFKKAGHTKPSADATKPVLQSYGKPPTTHTPAARRKP